MTACGLLHADYGLLLRLHAICNALAALAALAAGVAEQSVVMPKFHHYASFFKNGFVTIGLIELVADAMA